MPMVFCLVRYMRLKYLIFMVLYTSLWHLWLGSIWRIKSYLKPMWPLPLFQPSSGVLTIALFLKCRYNVYIIFIQTGIDALRAKHRKVVRDWWGCYQVNARMLTILGKQSFQRYNSNIILRLAHVISVLRSFSSWQCIKPQSLW